MAVPLLLLIVAAVAWSGYWWFISTNAEREFTRWQAQAVRSGVTLSCGSQNWGGYPFRVEMRCAPLELSWASPDGRSEIRLAELETMSQVYNPQHVVAIGTSPAAMRRLEEGDDAPELAIAATHDPARASARFDGRRLDQLSLTADNLQAEITERDRSGEGELTTIAARAFNLHFRFIGPPRDGRAALELASDGRAVKAEGDGLVSSLGLPVDLDRFELRARADKVPYPIENPDIALRGFAANGGTLHVDRLLAKSAETSFVARGTLTLDARGRATGDLSAEVVNFEGFLDRLRRAGRIGRLEAELATGLLSFLEGATSGDRGALSVDVQVKEGEVYFGPFQIAQIPPLF